MTKFLYINENEDEPVKEEAQIEQKSTIDKDYIGPQSLERIKHKMMSMSFEELQNYLQYNDTKMLRFLITSLREASPGNEMNMMRIMGDIIAQQIGRGGRI